MEIERENYMIKVPLLSNTNEKQFSVKANNRISVKLPFEDKTNTYSTNSNQKRCFEEFQISETAPSVHKKKKKESSLKQICTSILNKFINGKTKEIKLNDFAVELNVERRRVYDIVNVLEAFDMVKKHGKNRYLWLGIQNLKFALNKLETLSVPQIYVTKIFSHENLTFKKKSLTYLSIKLLKLFMIHKNNINFKELIKLFGEKYLNLKLNDKDKELKQSENKNKIRRLYDIINVFKSLGLAEKNVNSSGKSVLTFKGLKGLSNNISCLKDLISKDFDINGNILEINSVKSEKIVKNNFEDILPCFNKSNSLANSFLFKNEDSELKNFEIIKNNKKIKIADFTVENVLNKNKIFTNSKNFKLKKNFFTFEKQSKSFLYSKNLNCFKKINQDEKKTEIIKNNSLRIIENLEKIKNKIFKTHQFNFFSVLNVFIKNSHQLF